MHSREPLHEELQIASESLQCQVLCPKIRTLIDGNSIPYTTIKMKQHVKSPGKNHNKLTINKTIVVDVFSSFFKIKKGGQVGV